MDSLLRLFFRFMLGYLPFPLAKHSRLLLFCGFLLLLLTHFRSAYFKLQFRQVGFLLKGEDQLITPLLNIKGCATPSNPIKRSQRTIANVVPNQVPVPVAVSVHPHRADLVFIWGELRTKLTLLAGNCYVLQ